MKTPEQIDEEIFNLTKRIMEHMKYIVQCEDTPTVIIAIFDFVVGFCLCAGYKKDQILVTFNKILERHVESYNEK